jgi:hypothetical protein
LEEDKRELVELDRKREGVRFRMAGHEAGKGMAVREEQHKLVLFRKE